jgi:hypothetical protein
MTREQLTAELVAWIQKTGLAGPIPPDRMRAMLSIGHFSQEMLGLLQCDDLELVTTISVLEKMIFDHGLRAEHLCGLHGLICQPEKIFKSATRPDSSVVIMSLETLRARPIILPIELGKRMSKGQPAVHWLSSGYAKDSQDIIAKWKRDGLLIWER